PKSQFAELEHKVRQAVIRRRAEHNLRESEQTSRALLDATTDSVALISRDLTVLSANEAFSHRFNLNPDHMVGRSLYDFISPELSRERASKVAEVITTKKPVRFEDRTGEYFLENSIFPIFDEQGDVIRLAGYSRDITEKKRAEQDLHTAYEQIAADEEELREKYDELSLSEKQVRESEERLLMSQEIGSIGSWEYFFETNRIWVSAEALSIYGLPPVPSDYPIETIEACIIDRERVHQAFVDFLNGKREYDIEININPCDGSSSKVVHSIARLEKDDKNNPVKVVGVIQDISRRKRDEDEITFKNVILSTEQEVSPDGILIVDKNGMIFSYNQKFISIWKIPDEIITVHHDEPVLLFVSRQIIDPESFLDRVKYLYTHQDEKSFEEIFLKDGRVIERFSSPMMGKEGENYGRVWFFRDITERKRADDELRAAYEQITASEETLQKNYHELLRSQEAVQESEAWFRGLFDQAFQLAGVLDLSGKVTHINQTAMDLIGKSPQAVLNLPFWETPWWSHNQEAQLQVKDAVQRAKQGEQVRFETTHLDNTGNIHYIDFSIKPLTDENGTVFGLLPEGRDITFLKSVETKLRRSQEKFKSFFNHSHDAVFILDLKGRILDVNATMCRMYEIPYEDALAYTFEDYSGPERDISEAYRHWKLVLSGEDQLFSWQARRPLDGSFFHVEVYLTRIDGEDETLIQGNVRDVSVNKKTEDALKKSEERYRSLVETTGTGYVVLDMQGRVLDANKEYLRLTGRFSMDEISGRSLIDWTAPYDIERNSEEIRKCIQNGFVRGLEIDYIHPDGTIQPLEINASVVSSESEDVILTLCRDISVRKKWELRRPLDQDLR
ncbi:MAG: hypothetical protein CVV33_05695, partial [Methanomicrobiales archaeon HGW-Methanomicrobiales-4]